MKSIYKVLLMTAAVSVFTSCQSDLMDLSPEGSVSSGNMWNTENLTDLGVTGIYNTLFYGDVAKEIYKYDCLGVTSDCRDADYNLLKGSATATDGQFSTYWKVHYEGIHRANDAIKNIPIKSPVSDEKKARLVAEAKFLRAFFYYKLNMVYKGVPLYLEPIEVDECTRGRESEETIWNTVIEDLTACVNDANLPDRYPAGDAGFGRATKSAAYALRGKVYMWMQNYAKAEADFAKVGELGHSLFQGSYKELFKEANEQSPEMVFSVQCIGLSGYGNDISFRYGSRVSFGSCWNSYLPSTDFVDSYEWADGSTFDWNDVIPGYNEMAADARAVYFFRDNMTQAEIDKMAKDQKADMSKYLSEGNEARIKKAYENRDPRLTASIITPYSQYLGANSDKAYTYTLRWPYRGFDTSEPFDVKTDTNNRFFYLFRKFVAEGASEIPNRTYSPIDIPVIRYADVLLSRAEAINEQGFSTAAIDLVNQVRARAGVALLQNTDPSKPTYVNNQADLRERIRKERRWEFNGEGVNFFDEMRWKTWKDTKFYQGAGLKQIWGQSQYTNSWGGDYLYTWPIPSAECQMNQNLVQNEGWIN
ncbi:MAG TPA: RagB/SusD family nutrient uptake outer membrane protein [Porphyromonadaceae bacterium]|nr:RagB/SusD family nutrient uptake outer membrane protein [Porphyromonadaceae bacterium]